MEETLNPIKLSPEVENRIIGWLVKYDMFDELKSSDQAGLINFHHSLGQWIRNKFIWKHYDENDNFVHPDDISYEWIVEVSELIKSPDFDIKEWVKSHPECLV